VLAGTLGSGHPRADPEAAVDVLEVVTDGVGTDRKRARDLEVPEALPGNVTAGTGNTTGSCTGPCGAGGGISNDSTSTTTLTNVTVHGNETDATEVCGGVADEGTGALVIDDSLISGNQSGWGGASAPRVAATWQRRAAGRSPRTAGRSDPANRQVAIGLLRQFSPRHNRAVMDRGR